jgi:hypothetical protein
VEIIDHPGYLLADKQRLHALMIDGEEGNTYNIRDLIVQNLTVPKFWDPIEAFRPFPGGVREFLGNNGRYLITPEEASTIGSYYQQTKETIFVAIASYRDPECYPTVESIFKRSKEPNRIRVAIVDQRISTSSTMTTKDEQDPTCRPPTTESCRIDPDQILCKYKSNIDWMEYPAQAMVGPVFARHLAHRMYRGEYFVLQIDSHVRFVQDWDEDIIDQWYATGNEMAVISNYMSDITNSIDPVTLRSRKPHRASKYV